MANNLTGDFEAVVQFGVRKINGLLGALHQNGGFENTALKLLHSVSFRVGVKRPRPGDLADFGEWVRDLALARGSGGIDTVRGQVGVFAPPGAAKRMLHEFSQFGQLADPPPAPGTVRGTARAQLGTLAVSLPANSSSEVTVHAPVRAHYYPDTGTADLPKPVHGETEIAFDVQRHGSRFSIRPATQDAKIKFTPAAGTGLSPQAVDEISAQVRKAVRDNVSTLDVDLPDGFPFSAFKGVGSGATQALALPLKLSGTDLPSGNIASVTREFVGPAAFAIAVGKEFVTTTFQPTIASLMQIMLDFSVAIPVLPDPTYHFSVTNVELVPEDQAFILTVRGKAVTSYPLAPDFNNIVVRLRFTLVLLFNTLVIASRDDDITISGVPGRAINTVKLAVLAARNQALAPAQAALNQQLTGARTQLAEALRTFDSAATVNFRAGHSEENSASTAGAIAVTPDGIIIRGDIGGGTRLGPIIQIEETEHGQAFTALESWIPGGRVDRLIWSWVEFAAGGASIFSGVLKTRTEEHTFVFPKPPGVTELSRICLRIEGRQTRADGTEVNVSGGTTCHLPDFGEVYKAPSWWEPVTIPVWFPNSHEGTVLKDHIAAHVSVQSDTPRKSELTHNRLIYFADWQAEKPLDPLIRGLEHMLTKQYSLVVVVVVPGGAFDRTRREVEARLEAIESRFPIRLCLTEDNQCGWTRTFAVAKFPASYVINALGDFVWKHEGDAGPGLLANALDKHLLPAPAPRFDSLRLAIPPGQAAPDLFFAGEGGVRSALHRLRGRSLLINFWQAWSAPCLKELERLQRLHAESKGQGPLILAWHGGKDPKSVPEIRDKLGLTFSVMHDPRQSVGRKYGVRCWPTTVSVNAAGLVDHVQFGCQPPGRESPVQSCTPG